MDPTPLDATDDYLPTSQEGVWQAKAGTAAAGKMDLLSVLLHEYGHALGLAHSGAAGDFMNAALQSGQRRMPTAQQLQQMSDLVAQLRADFEPASAPGSASASASNQNSAPAQPALPGMPGDPDHPGYPLSLLGLLPLGLMRRSDGSMVRLIPYANPDSTPSSAVAQSVSVRAQDYMTAPYPHLTRGSFQNGLVDWEQAGAVSQQGGQSVTLGEAPGSTGQTRLAQAFVLNAQDRFLTFTVNNATLQNNSSADESAPQDAFEVALLNANTGTSLWTGANAGNGTYSGTSALSKTDALLSLQLASSALNASVQERATSVVSSKLNTDGSRTYLVDLRNIAAGNSGSNAGIAVNLSFDLIGFGTRSVGSGTNTGSPTGAPSNTGSKVTLRDVRMISSPWPRAMPPPWPKTPASASTSQPTT